MAAPYAAVPSVAAPIAAAPTMPAEVPVVEAEADVQTQVNDQPQPEADLEVDPADGGTMYQQGPNVDPGAFIIRGASYRN